MPSIDVGLYVGMKLTVCFTTPKRWTLLSRLIRWFTDSQVSHACIGGLELAGVPVLLGAGIKGVVPETRAVYEKSDKIVEEYEFEVPDEAAREVIARELNLRYDFLGVFGFGLAILAWRWLRLKVRHPFTSTRAVWCSEWVMHFPHEAWAGMDPETTSAEGLRRACRRAGLVPR